MFRRLNNKGETLAETLAAMLVVVLAIVMLAGAVVAASRVNNRIKVEDTDFRISESGSSSQTSINGKTVDIILYQTDNGYYYYEYDKE